MFLSRLHLDLRSREARRDVADPYQLHSTLCRAFCSAEDTCPPGEFLWRMEPVNSSAAGVPRIIVQSRVKPDWGRIGLSGWLADADRPLDLSPLLVPAALKAGRRLRFRLRANPCITRAGKRLGLLQQDEQRVWMERKGTQHGFTLPGVVMISEPRMLKSRKRSGQTMSIFSTLYDGVIEVVEPEIFLSALRTGIGHGKVMGLGLISIAPMG